MGYTGAVYPPVIVPPTVRGNYRHMAKRDAAVWEKFLQKHAAGFYGFSYDVALGGVTLPLGNEDPAALLAWRYSTALKIDAIGWQQAAALIIEVKPEAHVSAYGAALAYTIIAQRDKLTEIPVFPAIVCEGIQPDVEWLCHETGVTVYRV
jgi:hypothetical protein